MTYQPQIHHRRSIRLQNYDYSSAGVYFITICTFQRNCLFGHIAQGKLELNQFGEIAKACWQAIPQHFAHVRLDAFVVMPNHVHGILIMAEQFPTEPNPPSIDPQTPRTGMAMPCPNEYNGQHHSTSLEGKQTPRTGMAMPCPNEYNGQHHSASLEGKQTPRTGMAMPCPNEYNGQHHSTSLERKQTPRTGMAMPCPNDIHRKFGQPIAGSLATIIGSFKSAVTKQINILREAPGTPVWQRNYYEHIIRNDEAFERIQAYIHENPMRWKQDSLFLE